MNTKPQPGARPYVPPEYAFALVGLVMGLLLVFANPPWQANDEDRHFYTAYFYASGQNGMLKKGTEAGGYLPVNLLAAASRYQGIAFSPSVKLSKAKINELAIVPLVGSRTVFYDNPNRGTSPAGYLPHIAAIAIGKALNFNALHLLWAARTAGLVTYLGILFAAIRITPAHKWVLFAVGLTPMALYQATSVTYDALCIALSALIVAMVVRFTLRDRPISAAELAAFFAVVLLQRFAKDGYFLLPFLFLIIPRRNVGSRAKAAAIVGGLCIISVLPLLTWDAYVSSLGLPTADALQKDFVFDAWKQLDFYSQQPAQFIAYLVLNVADQAKDWIIGGVGRFGYAYAALPAWLVFVHGLVLLALSVLDGSRVRTLAPRERLIAASVALASIALIIVGFFVRGSPVGAHVIFGLQGRYFLPLLPCLLLLNYKLCCGSVFAENWKSVVVPLYCAGVLGYSVYFINDFFYIS